jgi:hypothetical protein
MESNIKAVPDDGWGSGSTPQNIAFWFLRKIFYCM